MSLISNIRDVNKEYTTIYYNDNDNTFQDDYDADYEYDILSIMENDQIIYYKRVGGIVYSQVDDEEFEIVFPIRDQDRTLYYDIEANVIYDEHGINLFNIFSVITPNDLYLFKNKKETIEIRGTNGHMVELIWPNPINY